MIDRDPLFPFPDYRGLEVTVQDCWRTRERRKEQDAVRSLLRKMNIRYMGNDRNHENTDFCGSTLYREQPAKNSTLAPRHYVEQARGKFTAHTLEEQTAIMQDYCRRYQTDTVVCYCHYCLEGLLQGNKDGRHIADLLFKSDNRWESKTPQQATGHQTCSAAELRGIDPRGRSALRFGRC